MTCPEEGYSSGYPLTLAVENGHSEVVKLLLEYRANSESIKYTYDGTWSSKETPLLLAIYREDFGIAKMLLKHGADVDGEFIINGEPHTPLSYSVAKKKVDWAQFLLRNGADIGREIDGTTVSKYAIKSGRDEMLKLSNIL